MENEIFAEKKPGYFVSQAMSPVRNRPCKRRGDGLWELPEKSVSDSGTFLSEMWETFKRSKRGILSGLQKTQTLV